MNNISNQFQAIASDIIINQILTIDNVDYKMCDIEFYLCSQDHKDTFTPLNEKLLEKDKCCIIENKLYLSMGTKGLGDLVDSDDAIYFGVLVRAIKGKLDGVIIEGGVKIGTMGKEYCLKKDVDVVNTKRIIKSGVRNLGSTKLNDVLSEFINKNYRFSTEWHNLKKKLIKYGKSVNSVKVKDVNFWEKFVPPANNISYEDLLILERIWEITKKIVNNEITDKNKDYFVKKLGDLKNSNVGNIVKCSVCNNHYWNPYYHACNNKC